MEPFHKQLTPLLEGDAPSAPKLQARRAVLSAPTTIESRQYAGLTPQSALRPQSSSLGRRAASAFTLIESVVAIGLFAFVIVGIVGLFGSALERQRQASFETRSVMIAQQTLARIRAASSVTNISLTRGQTNDSRYFTNLNLSNAFAVGFYQRDGTECSEISVNISEWTGTNMPNNVSNIFTKSLTELTHLSNGLYRVDVRISEPANLPLNARKYTNTFNTFATFPN